jgi:4a-hydroxytetrahydrobiopterin dehydratase
MSIPSILKEDDIRDELNALPLWNLEGKTIVREFVASNFASAVGFINAIAIIAEKADHHPDILLYAWNKVRISLSTHSEGGLTQNDFNLAKQIEDLKYI